MCRRRSRPSPPRSAAAPGSELSSPLSPPFLSVPPPSGPAEPGGCPWRRCPSRPLRAAAAAPTPPPPPAAEPGPDEASPGGAARPGAAAAMETAEKECGALGGLFQAIINDMKVGPPPPASHPTVPGQRFPSLPGGGGHGESTGSRDPAPGGRLSPDISTGSVPEPQTGLPELQTGNRSSDISPGSVTGAPYRASGAPNRASKAPKRAPEPRHQPQNGTAAPSRALGAPTSALDRYRSFIPAPGAPDGANEALNRAPGAQSRERGSRHQPRIGYRSSIPGTRTPTSAPDQLPEPRSPPRRSPHRGEHKDSPPPPPPPPSGSPIPFYCWAWGGGGDREGRGG